MIFFYEEKKISGSGIYPKMNGIQGIHTTSMPKDKLYTIFTERLF